jgi:hypothetical protein
MSDINSIDVLSWDCANKTLAWSYFTINLASCQLAATFEVDARSMRGVDLVAKYGSVPHFITYKSLGVKDILCGKKTKDCSAMERTRALHGFLSKNPILGQMPKNTRIYIEAQPLKVGRATNRYSGAVSYQLAFFYVDYEVIFVRAKLKNELCLGPDLAFGGFLESATKRRKSKRDASYCARKEHSRANFLYFMRVIGQYDLVSEIPMKIMDDVADSTMQALASLRPEILEAQRKKLVT